MSKVRLKVTRVSLALALAFVVAAGVTFSTAGPAAAAGYCQCTTYVANHDGLSQNYPNAADWGNGYLQGNGWAHEQNGYIRGGDIVVFQGPQELSVTKTPGCCYFNYWINTSAGHVGIVTGLTWHNTVPGYYTVRVQGANQGLTPEWTDSNCTDVSQFYFNTTGNYSGHWDFYY